MSQPAYVRIPDHETRWATFCVFIYPLKVLRYTYDRCSQAVKRLQTLSQPLVLCDELLHHVGYYSQHLGVAASESCSTTTTESGSSFPAEASMVIGGFSFS